jgi:hypothetical protein
MNRRLPLPPPPARPNLIGKADAAVDHAVGYLHDRIRFLEVRIGEFLTKEQADALYAGRVTKVQTPFHSLLSLTHIDTTWSQFGNVKRGDIIVGKGLVIPKWERLGLGTAGQVLRSDGLDALWGTSLPDEIYVQGSGRQTHHVLSTASDTTLVISANYDLFDASDVGKTIRVILRNPASLEDFETTIVSVTSPTAAVLAQPPTITSTTGEAYWFTDAVDDTAALQAALDGPAATLRLGPSTYVITGQLLNKRRIARILGSGSWRTTILCRKAYTGDSLHFTDVMGLNLEGFSIVGPGMDGIVGGTIRIEHRDFDNTQRLYTRDVMVRHLADTGFVIHTPILSTLLNNRVEFGAGHGFQIIGGTTTDLINDYATTCIGPGFLVEEGAVDIGIQGGATEDCGAAVVVKDSYSVTIDHHDSEDELDRAPVAATFTPTLSLQAGGFLTLGTYYLKFCWMHGVAYGVESPESLPITTDSANQTIVASLGTVPANVYTARIYITPPDGGAGAEGFLEDIVVTPGTTATYTRSTQVGVWRDGIFYPDVVGCPPPAFFYNGHGYVVSGSQKVEINNSHSRAVPLPISRHFLITDDSSEVTVGRPRIVQGASTPDYDIEITAPSFDNELITNLAGARILDSGTNTLIRYGASFLLGGGLGSTAKVSGAAAVYFQLDPTAGKLGELSANVDEVALAFQDTGRLVIGTITALGKTGWTEKIRVLPSGYVGIGTPGDPVEKLELYEGKFAVSRTNATDDIFGARVIGESYEEFKIRAGGWMGWGPGDATYDTFLERGDVSLLKVTGELLTTVGFKSLGAMFFGASSPNWAFRITNAGYQSWGPGDGTYDASFFRDSAGKLKILGVLAVSDTLQALAGFELVGSMISKQSGSHLVYHTDASKSVVTDIQYDSGGHVTSVTKETINYVDSVTPADYHWLEW